MSPSHTVEDAHRLEFWCGYSHVLYLIAALRHRLERSANLSSQILLGYVYSGSGVRACAAIFIADVIQTLTTPRL